MMQFNKLTRTPVGVLFPTIDTSQFPLHRVCHKVREALWRGPRWCFKRTRCGGNRRVSMVGNNTVGADLSRKPPIYDSAGKFCLDKWTRKREEGRVEEEGHEEVLHDERKEDHDVTARPPARTYSRTDQPHRSRQFSQGNAGHASARCTGPDLSGCRLCPALSQTGTSGRSAVETGAGHRLASAGKPLGPSSRRDGSSTLGLEICAVLAPG